MSFTQALFSFRGRLGRLAFFGYLLFMYAVVGLLFGAGLISVGAKDGGGGLGVLVIAAAVILFLWIDLALLIKRLHDLDFSSNHLIWVSAPSMIATFGASGLSGGILALLWVAHFLIGLYLLFAPGTLGPNKFGQRPGTIAPPESAPPSAAFS